MKQKLSRRSMPFEHTPWNRPTRAFTQSRNSARRSASSGVWMKSVSSIEVWFTASHISVVSEVRTDRALRRAVSMQLTMEDGLSRSKARKRMTLSSSGVSPAALKLSRQPEATMADSHSLLRLVSPCTAFMCPATCSRRAT